MKTSDAFATAELGANYYSGELHYRVLAERIVGTVQNGRLFIVVTGDPPPNPSILSATLNEVLHGQQPIIVFTSGPEFRADALLLACRNLSAHPAADDTPPAKPRSPLFIIDDADQLADPQIEEIYEKSQAVDWAIAMILLGRSDFFARLERSQLHLGRNKRAIRLNFYQLEKREILPYLREQIGPSAVLRSYTDDAVEVIWSMSRGDPQIVNRLARRLLDGAPGTASVPVPRMPPATEPGQAVFNPLLAEPLKASLPAPEGATAPGSPAEVAPVAAGDTLIDKLSRRHLKANVSDPVWLKWSLTSEALTTRDLRDQLAASDPAPQPAERQEPRPQQDAVIGSNAEVIFFGRADENAEVRVPAWPEGVSWPPPPEAPAAGSVKRLTVNLSLPKITAVCCLAGLGLAGLVFQLVRETAPTEPGVVSGPSAGRQSASSIAANLPRVAPPPNLPSNANPEPPLSSFAALPLGSAIPSGAASIPSPTTAPSVEEKLPPPGADPPVNQQVDAIPALPPSSSAPLPLSSAVPPVATSISSPTTAPSVEEKIPPPGTDPPVTQQADAVPAPPPSSSAPLPLGSAVPPVAASISSPTTAPSVEEKIPAPGADPRVPLQADAVSAPPPSSSAPSPLDSAIPPAAALPPSITIAPVVEEAMLTPGADPRVPQQADAMPAPAPSSSAPLPLGSAIPPAAASPPSLTIAPVVEVKIPPPGANSRVTQQADAMPEPPASSSAALTLGSAIPSVNRSIPSPTSTSAVEEKPLPPGAASPSPQSNPIREPLALSTPPLPLGSALPAVDASAPNTTPASSTLQFRREVTGLVERGDMLFGTGDVASARLFYERAADAGDPKAALRLGESFDPDFLEQAHIRGVRSDLAAARIWYGRAVELGSVEAGTVLKRLESKLKR